MEVNNFLEIAKKYKIYHKDSKGRFSSYGNPVTLKCYLGEEWSGGGVTGGSCWEDSRNYSYDAEQEPDFTSLDGFLLEVAPNISFLKYKKLEEIIKYSSHNEYEYYGNNSITNYKMINLKDLYDFLVDGEII